MTYWLTFTPFLSIPMFLVNEDRLVAVEAEKATGYAPLGATAR